jgi:hypothetical protein
MSAFRPIGLILLFGILSTKPIRDVAVKMGRSERCRSLHHKYGNTLEGASNGGGLSERRLVIQIATVARRRRPPTFADLAAKPQTPQIRLWRDKGGRGSQGRRFCLPCACPDGRDQPEITALVKNASRSTLSPWVGIS